MNPYHHLVSEYTRLAREGKSYPLGKFARLPKLEVAADAPKVLIFSPHPDDEVIMGGLALRLMREARWRIMNVPVTQGSNPMRKAERLAEVKACCDYIGFGLITITEGGLEEVNVRTRGEDPGRWREYVKVISKVLIEQQPRVIFLPHDADWNSSHVGTHYVVMDALKSLPMDFDCHVVETEFWGAMSSPNLIVEINAQDLGDLMTALSFHAGEVRRNPYHLFLPAWMQDNVRRGGELVGGQGRAAPEYGFATLYRLQRWQQGRLEKIFEGGRMLGANQEVVELFA